MSARWVNGILVDAKEWYRPTEDTVVQLPIDNQQQLNKLINKLIYKTMTRQTCRTLTPTLNLPP